MDTPISANTHVPFRKLRFGVVASEDAGHGDAQSAERLDVHRPYESGPDHDKIFHHISDEGFAAASIGQVHRAVLKDGRPVAVKIQYPDVKQVSLKRKRLLRLQLRS